VLEKRFVNLLLLNTCLILRKTLKAPRTRPDKKMYEKMQIGDKAMSKLIHEVKNKFLLIPVLFVLAISGCKSTETDQASSTSGSGGEAENSCGTVASGSSSNSNCHSRVSSPVITQLGENILVLNRTPRILWYIQDPMLTTQAQVVRVSDGVIMRPWANISPGTTFVDGLNLAYNTQYKINLRNQDQAGNLSSVVSSDPWSPVNGQGSWQLFSGINAPSQRWAHSMVWTGSKMIVWGGQDVVTGASLNSGAVYDPTTDTWFTMATVNAPSARSHAATVWTGTEMIVWDGYWSGDGKRYNPATNVWSNISTVGAPSPRVMHSAVWTGSKMIIWGGQIGSGHPRAWVDDGAIYNPSTDSWSPMSNVGAPSPRESHAAVWTGNSYLPVDTGGVYDLATDTWTSTTTAGAPPASNPGGGYQTYAWTGTELILKPGFSYDPATDRWSAIARTTAALEPSEINMLPAVGNDFTASVWIGAKLFSWGGWAGYGTTNSGGLYDPSSDTWVGTTIMGAPLPAMTAKAVWTGSKVIVWGGGVSAFYTP
jgi:hypothetical protein